MQWPPVPLQSIHLFQERSEDGVHEYEHHVFGGKSRSENLARK